MPGLVSNLNALLNEQAENYEQLSGLSLEKKDVIIKNDVESLQKITTLENIMVGRNQKLDRGRQSIMKDIASVLNKKESELTLSALADLIEGQPDHGELVVVIERLRKAVEELKKINEQNKLLIENSLDYIDYTMNVLRSTLDGGVPDYGVNDDEARRGRGFFDAKQ